nr:MAG TPA: hypothetical protein [Caudoviricetes sp.]
MIALDFNVHGQNITLNKWLNKAKCNLPKTE